MTPTENAPSPSVDVFAAARWLDELWNSSARATGPDTIEWQCSTWGSGRGAGDWLHVGTFRLAIAAFTLDTSTKYEGRDELIVHVPLAAFPRLASLIDQIGEEVELWPWLQAEETDSQIAIAARILDMPTNALIEKKDLLEALQIQ